MIAPAVIAGCIDLVLGFLLCRAFLPIAGVKGRMAVWLAMAGACVAVPVLLLRGYLLDSVGWTLSVQASGPWIALLSAMAIVAPLDQAALVVVVWPIYRGHRFESLGTAISAAVMAAVGFGTVQAIAIVATASSGWAIPQVSATLVSRAFCAGAWACCLSSSHARFRHYFPLVWLLATCLDGFMRHLEEGRGPGWLVIALPLVAVMASSAWFVRVRLAGVSKTTPPVHASRLGLLVDPHTIEGVKAAWHHTHRPALLHWIVGGAFVSFGANIVGCGLGVAVAHLLHIDLSRVNETDVGAMAPLSLLGLFTLLSYAAAGYLTAKASNADSVFEPGMAALISIVAVTLLLSLTAPVTIVLALALAPIAFGLACLGALLGLSRQERVSWS